MKLVSTSADSYASFPRGEAFHFAFSPNGRLLLAFGSCRVYVLDVATPSISVKRELKVLRRPVSIAILDDGSQVAVLSSDHQVNIYNLAIEKPVLLRSVPLDNPPRSIALSPGGTVLAAAYEGGIEVYSLAAQALSTDRRAVKCNAVDSLSFSSDGTLLLGTTLQSNQPNTVALFAPYHIEVDHDMPLSELLSQMWTTQILFPNASRICSHATLLPHPNEGEVSWIFTYDTTLETFRAVRVDDLKNGERAFTGPITPANLIPGLSKTLPASNAAGEMVAVGYAAQDIWLYGVPEGLGVTANSAQLHSFMGDAGTWPVAQQSSLASSTESRPSGDEAHPEVPGISNAPGQSSIRSFKIGIVDDVSAVRWVTRSPVAADDCLYGERLVAVAPGGVDQQQDGMNHSIDPVDGGRIVIFDFEPAVNNGETEEIVIEVGGTKAELLEEEARDLEIEVALVRRRTLNQRASTFAGSHSSPTRATTFDSGRPALPGPSMAGSSVVRGADLANAEASRSCQLPITGINEDPSMEEVQEALDGPYSHNNPRSRTTLRRAATAAAVRHRSRVPRHQPNGNVRDHPYLGRRELPHESDADNWVPPPPPYQPDPDVPLPDHLRASLLPRQRLNMGPLQRRSNTLSGASRATMALEGLTQSALQRTRTTLGRAGNTFGVRRPSESTLEAEGRAEDEPAPRTRSPQITPPIEGNDPVVPTGDEDEDLYSASPLSSPVQRTVIAQGPVPANIEMPEGSPGSIRPALSSPFPSLPDQLSSPELQTPSSIRSPSHQTGDSVRRKPLNTPQLSGQALLNLNLPSPLSTFSSGSAASVVSPIQRDDVPRRTLSVHHDSRMNPSSSSSQQHAMAFSAAPPATQPDEWDGPALPSTEQMANLKKRYSRPPDLILARPVSAGYTASLDHVQPSPPRAARGATQPRHSASLDSIRSVTHNLSPESRLAPPTLSSPNLMRPEIRRLETIQSVASQTLSLEREPSRPQQVAPLSTVPRRKPSRAERSAASNVRRSKSRGWVSKKARPGRRNRAGARDDPGEMWTDVNGETRMENVGDGKKPSRCLLM